ncbi:MAG: c-type heme family protein [Desulfovibrionaceae bacterium]
MQKETPRTTWRIHSAFLILHAVFFLLMAGAVVFLVNRTMKEQALYEAQDKSRLLLDHNLAIHTYFTHQLKPAVFKLAEDQPGPEYFDPAWMSSTYAVRNIHDYFLELSDIPYYYKEGAINARSPENEADPAERAFLEELQDSPELISRNTISAVNGQRQLVTMRRGEVMEASCLRCHSVPENAPAGLVQRYGAERSFDREEGEVVDAISIRIPLQEAYAHANRFSTRLSAALLVLMAGLLAALYYCSRRYLLTPLLEMRDTAQDISSNPDKLGETLPRYRTRELSQLSQAFNEMSTALRRNRDELERRVVERTEELSEANEELSQINQEMAEEMQRRQAAEERLRHSEELHRLAMDATSDGVWDYNPVRDEMLLGDRFATLLGYQPGELPADFSHLISIVHPEDRSRVLQRFEDYIQGLVPVFEAEFRMRSKSGEWVWILSRAKITERDEQGRPLRVIGAHSDITSRKLAEQELAASEQRYRTLVEAAPMLIMVHQQRRIVYVNPVGAQGLGADNPENLMGLPLMNLVHPDSLELVKRRLENIEAGKPNHAEEIRIRGLDQRDSLMACVSLPVRYEGQDAGLAMCLDINELKRLERELLAAKEQAEQANRAKSEFLANMSHEIRTPLNGALGMLQYLRLTRLDEEQRECVDTALLSGESLLSLINDILDFSRIEAGKLSIQREPFYLGKLLDEVMAIFRPQTARKGLELRLELSPDAPNAVSSDPARLRQILFNLLGNAVKFTFRGRVVLRVAPMDLQGGFALSFIVEDTGPGIPADLADRLFEPFTQADGRWTRAHQGAGLGLSIVKRLTHLLGGQVDVQSQEGEGTSVRVVLPMDRVQLDDASSQDGVEGEAGYSPKSLRVLLVEDEKVNRLSVQRYLEKAGHGVVLAENGREALDTLRSQTFDVVIMDVQMPVMGGLEAARRIRSDESGEIDAQVPILALSARAFAGDRQECLEAGMNEHMPKPVNMEQLLKTLQRLARGDSSPE